MMFDFQQGPVTIGGSNSNFLNDFAVSALSSSTGCWLPEDQRDASIDATSWALLLLALSALSKPSNDRRQFVLDRNPGPTTSYYSGKKDFPFPPLYASIIALVK